MGVNITELLTRNEVELKNLHGKIIAVDSSIFLYQFLTTIRQRDGTPLMDSKGNVTSHLSGLFSRTAKLASAGIKLAYVFDGKAPELKEKERERRRALKEDADEKYKEAKSRQDVDEMKKFATRSTRLTNEMIEESKELIRAFGMPVVEAPSEAEAQAAYLVRTEKAFACASQDADTLMFGTDRLIRNMSIAGKRKKTNKLSFETIKPEMIELSKCLNSLGVDQNQFIVLCMLVGTDFNIGGIKGIGPKNALKLLNKYKTDFDDLFKEAKWDENFDMPWTEVYYTIKNMPTEDVDLTWESIDVEKIKNILVDKHEFSEERIDNTIQKLVKEKEAKQQKGLGDFF